MPLLGTIHGEKTSGNRYESLFHHAHQQRCAVKIKFTLNGRHKIMVADPRCVGGLINDCGVGKPLARKVASVAKSAVLNNNRKAEREVI